MGEFTCNTDKVEVCYVIQTTSITIVNKKFVTEIYQHSLFNKNIKQLITIFAQ